MLTGSRVSGAKGCGSDGTKGSVCPWSSTSLRRKESEAGIGGWGCGGSSRGGVGERGGATGASAGGSGVKSRTKNT
jgi:hypothetical protein